MGIFSDTFIIDKNTKPKIEGEFVFFSADFPRKIRLLFFSSRLPFFFNIYLHIRFPPYLLLLLYVIECYVKSYGILKI